MRQAGILAAAGLLALTDMTGRLEEDHRRARKLAEGLARIPGVQVDMNRLDINMVFFTIPSLSSPENGQYFITELQNSGVLASPPEQGNFRFVTHYWISDTDIDIIIHACKHAMALVQ